MRGLRSSKLAILMASVLLLSLMLAVPIAGGAEVQYVYSPDAFEPDDDPTMAKVLDEVTYHNFDNDLDVDFAKISAEATGQVFVLETIGLDGRNFDSEIHVWSVTTTGSPDVEIISNDDSDIWDYTYASTVFFEAPEPGDYLVQVIQNSEGDLGSYMLTIAEGDAVRVSGSDRYGTASMISRQIYSQAQLPGGYGSSGPEIIVLASGATFADSLAGASFAMQNDGVLLLTDPMSLTPTTADEIDRLTYSYGADVYIVGGINSVSAAVMDAVKVMDGVVNVYRVSGASRFDTAAEIADETSSTVKGLSSRVFIANGRNFPDGLAVGPVAAFDGSAILLTESDDVPDVTMDWIRENGIDEVVLVGGLNSANADVFAELASEVTTAAVTRIAGDNRYQTAKDLAVWAYDEGLYYGDAAIIATGANWPDGLAAGTMCWYYNDADGCPLLLTAPSALSTEVAGFFVETGDGVSMPCYVTGGLASVPKLVFDDIRDLYMLDLMP